MKIFVSYTSEQAEVAQSLDLALRAEGHSIFFDRASLPSGEAYNRKIRDGVQDCDLFIFLVSPQSVTHGRYSLAELEFAQAKWPNPAGHVLPVLVTPTEMNAVPPYLKAVSMLQPSGDIAASVAAEVERLAKPWRYPRLRQSAAMVLVVLVGAAGAVWLARAYLHEQQRAEAIRLVNAAKLQEQTGNYASAWDLAANAASNASTAEVVGAQEQVAMEWLRNIWVIEGKETFTDIVNKVLPVLSQCAASAPSQRAADCLAHLGWADFLRSREGAGGLDPAQYYRRAFEVDPGNVFAHTMLAHHLARASGAINDIRSQFSAALASGRERGFVRHYQFAALLYYHSPQSEEEAIRVADDMRRNSEPMAGADKNDYQRWQLWNVYYDRVIRGNDKAAFLSALPPRDHLATFRWLFPEDSVPDDKRNLYLFMLATFEEGNGQQTEALKAYRAVQDALAGQGAVGGPLVDATAASIKRLSH